MRAIAMLALAAWLGTLAVPTVRAAEAEVQAKDGAPAGAEVQAQVAEPSILVFPLVPIGDPGRSAWMGRAFQQNLITELGRLTHVQVTPAPEDAAAVDTDSARKVAREQGATLVVVGAFQVIADDLRVTGQIVEAASGRAVGALKATGAQRDLFALEDAFAQQARQAVLAHAPPPAPPAADPALVAAAAAPARPVLPQRFPWDRDAQDIREAREQLRYDLEAEYAADRYRYAYYGYGGYYGGWYGYGYGLYPFYGGFIGHRHHHHHHGHHGVTVFPGGIVRGKLRAIPGGVVNIGWHW